VLVKELQALCLNIRVLDRDGEEIDLSVIGSMDDNTPHFTTIDEVDRAVDSAKNEDAAAADDEAIDESELDEDGFEDAFGEDEEEYRFDEADGDYDDADEQ